MSKDYLGKIVGNYEILEKTNNKDKSGHAIYRGKCIHCGTLECFPLRAIYSSGKVCSHFDKFGFSTNVSKNEIEKRLLVVLNGIKSRCYDKNGHDFRWYGNKGIKVCEDWTNDFSKFVKWSLENGYKKGLTIDRIDSSKDYSPENCQWISRSENSRKAGKVNWITINGITLTGRQWSLKIKQGVNFVNRYIRLYGIEKTKKIIENKLRGELV